MAVGVGLCFEYAGKTALITQGVVKKLGGDPAGTTEPKGYSTPHGIMLGI